MMNQHGPAVDEQTVVEMYEHHRLEIVRYARRMLHDHEMAEDCVAEIFCRF
jgi:DNA-directed RNA polymerase specialized sigma24 family protein